MTKTGMDMHKRHLPGRRVLLAGAMIALLAGVLASCSKGGVHLGPYVPDVEGADLAHADVVLGGWCENVRVVIDPPVDLAVVDQDQVVVVAARITAADEVAPAPPTAAVLHEGWVWGAATAPASTAAPVTADVPDVDDAACQGDAPPTAVLSLGAVIPDVVPDAPITVGEATALLAAVGLVPDAGGARADAPVLEQSPAQGTFANLGTQQATVTLTTGIWVPRVTDLTATQACAELAVQRLDCQGAGQADDSARVTDQVPQAGSGAVPGDPVQLIFGTAPVPVVVPDVRTQRSGEAACRVVERAGLHCTIRGDSQDPVSRQEPQAGADAALGSWVTITTTPPLVQVPNVVGLSGGQSCSVLAAAGFTCATDGRADFDVVAQNPAGTAFRGSVVTLTVQPRLPNLAGRSEEQARGIVEDLGLVFEISGDIGKDTIVSQDPVAGHVAPGSTVTVTFQPKAWHETMPGQVALWAVSGIVAALGGLALRAAVQSARRRRRARERA
jgi:beta-lactam-binding protein with PASTA domain